MATRLTESYSEQDIIIIAYFLPLLYFFYFFVKALFCVIFFLIFDNVCLSITIIFVFCSFLNLSVKIIVNTYNHYSIMTLVYNFLLEVPYFLPLMLYQPLSKSPTSFLPIRQSSSYFAEEVEVHPQSTCNRKLLIYLVLILFLIFLWLQKLPLIYGFIYNFSLFLCKP